VEARRDPAAKPSARTLGNLPDDAIEIMRRAVRRIARGAASPFERLYRVDKAREPGGGGSTLRGARPVDESARSQAQLNPEFTAP
jgi:hypothetical protein